MFRVPPWEFRTLARPDQVLLLVYANLRDIEEHHVAHLEVAPKPEE